MAYCIECNKNIVMISDLKCPHCGSKMEFPKAQTFEAYNKAASKKFQAIKESELTVLQEKLQWAMMEKNQAKSRRKQHLKSSLKDRLSSALLTAAIIAGALFGFYWAYQFYIYGYHTLIVFLVSIPGTLCLYLRWVFTSRSSSKLQTYTSLDYAPPEAIRSKIRRLGKLRYSIQNYEKLKENNY